MTHYRETIFTLSFLKGLKITHPSRCFEFKEVTESAIMKMRLQIGVLLGIILLAAFVASCSSEEYVDIGLSQVPTYKGV